MTEAQKPWEQQYDSGATDEGAEPWKQNYGAPRGLKGWKSGSNSGFDAPKPSAFEGVKDSAIALGTGVTQGIGMLANVAGADNAVSRTMDDATKALSEYESPYRKDEKQERARKIKEAEESGSTLKEVGAYLGSFAEAPLDTTLNALGTSLPTLAAGFIPGAGQAAVAARVAQLGLGAAQGVGAVKGQIFDEVKQAWKEKDATEEDASARAAQAQSYTGDNAGSIALGGAFGAAAGSFGAEAAVRRMAGKEVAERAAQTSVLKGMGMGALKEAPMEGLQGGQERLASNLALQNEGFDQGTWTGVLGSSALEATAAAPMGAGFGAWEAAGARGNKPAGDKPEAPDLTTSPGAADPNAQQQPPATPPEAPDLTTSPGAGVARDGIDYTRDVDTSGLQLQDPAEAERAQAATIDYEPGDTTPQWDTQPGASAARDGLDIPPPEFDTGNLGIDAEAQIRAHLERSAAAGGALSPAALTAIDVGATPVQFVGATGRDLQPRPTGPGIGNDGNIIDVQAREVPDQRAISTPGRIGTNDQSPAGQQQQASQPLALAAPSNLREGLDRVRQQKQDAANALAAQAQAQAAAPATTAPAAGTGDVQAAGPASTLATTGATSEPTPNQAIQAVAQPAQVGAAPTVPSRAPVAQGRDGAQGGQQPAAAAGLTDAATTPTNPGAQAAPAAGAQAAPQAEDPAQRIASTGDAWARMPTVERQALAQRADLKPVVQKNVHRAAWADLNRDVQRKLADAMAPVAQADAAAQDAAADQVPVKQEPSASAGAAPVRQGGGQETAGDLRALAAQFRERHKQTGQDTDRTFAAVIDQFAGEVEQGKRTRASFAEAEKRYREILGQATHKDPGQPAEAATPGVVTDSLKKAARNEDTKPSEMRKWLLAEIDKELLQAPDRADYDEAVKRFGDKDAISMFTGNGPLGKNSETGFVTFDVPGDGKYKVRNSVRGLLEFRKNVMASGGFKDSGQKQVKPEQNQGVQGGSGGKMAAITNMIEEGDFEAARDYAEAVGIKLEDVKVPRGDMKPAWEKYLKDGALPSAPDTRQKPAPKTAAQLDEEKRQAQAATGPVAQGEGERQEAGTDASEAIYRELIAEMNAKIGERQTSFDADIVNLKSQHFRGTGVFKGLRSKKAKDEAFNDAVRELRLSNESDQKAILDEYRAKIDAHPYESVRRAEGARKTREIKAQMEADAARKAAQPITRADVEAAQQQAAAIIGARIDAMSAGDVNKIAKKFLPTMGMKPTMSKANNKAAMTDAKINLMAAAAEVGAVLPAEVTRALQADMEGRVVDVAQDDGITKPETIEETRQGDDGNVAMFSRKQSEATPETANINGLNLKFSRAAKASTDANLIITHNLSAENLLHAQRMGGLATPSLAVTTTDTPLHGFGEITLIGGADMAKPGGDTKVFGADIYSPRYPSVDRDIDSKALQRWNDELEGVRQRYGFTGDLYSDDLRGDREGIDNAERNVAVAADFLEQSGIKPKILYREGMKKERVAALRRAGFAKHLKTTNEFALEEDAGFRAAAIQYQRSVYEDLANDKESGPFAKRYQRILNDFNSDEHLQAREVRDLAREIANAARQAAKPEVDRRNTEVALKQQIQRAKLEGQYKKHVADKLSSVTKSERIFQGYTNNGRRYIPHTLENVVKILKKDLRGGENFNYGVGSLRAKYTPQFKSVEAIRAAKDKLISQEQFDALRQEIDGEFNRISTLIDSTADTETITAILEGSARMNPVRAAQRYDIDIDADTATEVSEYLDKLRSMPTSYFEAKITRAVGLDEFTAAVVPRNLPPEILQILKDAGIQHITTYKADDKDARAAAVKKQADNLGSQVKFSFAGQQAQTADQHALSEAQSRLDAGADPEQVRQDTGWHKGADGKWRFEISDADARLKDRAQWTAKIDGINAKLDAALQAQWQAEEQRNYFLRARGESPSRISSETKKTPEFKALAKALKSAEAATEKARHAAFLARQGDSLITVGDVLSHPALFAAYPGIADVRVDINDSLPAGNAAYTYELRAIELSGKSDAQQLLSTLLHEIQHGIQHIEGFAMGGNEDSRSDVMQAVSQQRSLWADVYAVRRDLDAGKKLETVLAEWQDFLDAQPSAEALRIAQDPELETAVALQNMETLERQYAQLRNEGRGDTYRRLAGEVEARNTQARQGMNDAQRRATPPSQTADVADSDVIVTFSGKEMHSAPLPANAAQVQEQATPRTPVTAIRAAITQAYGKLLGQLESKGLVTLAQTEAQAVEAAAHARAKKTGGDVAQIKRSLTAAMQGGTASQNAGIDQLNKGKPGLDIKRSSNGAVQGFFDPQTGQSFLIADNLTAESAPGVLMHEVGIHMAADGSMKALFNRAALMLKMQNADPFMQRVQAHMDAAKETSNEEAAAYLVEAYENDRANAPASVRKWLADLLAAVKAWMYRKGITGADSLTVADIAAVARANAKALALKDAPTDDTANFAANPARRPGSAQDKAVMQAIADGKNARDVLRLIANGSKDPFLRQVAKMLLKAGITPNIQFGHIGKDKKGNPIHGQYRGKSDTIAIAGSAEYAAERIFMHEAMHAATMRALKNPGLVKLQLQKLLEHVRKQGGAAGFYGLKNVDEFVVEVFTNPDFQKALRTMSAPTGSPLKSAWHSFVQVLRRILGLGDNSTSVLSQALELGVAAVRQDMVLRRQGAQATRTANAGQDGGRGVGDADPAEARRVQSAIEGKSLLDAARFLTQSSNKARAAVAQKVLEKLERLERAGVSLQLNIVHRGDMAPAAMANARGYTETGFDSKGRDIAVWLNGADVTGKVGTEEEVLLHELVHATTSGMVFYGRSQPTSLAGKHVRDLMAVTDAIASHISQRFTDADAGKATLTEFEQDMRAGANNAFRSDDEVLAWALTNSEAQQYLETIPYKSGSLWSNFVQSVRSLLGLSPANDTALSEVLRVSERLLTDDAPDAGRAAFWHKRGLPMVQQQGRGSQAFTSQRGDGNSATGNNGNFDPEDPDIRNFGMDDIRGAFNERKTVIAGQTSRAYTPQQQAAMQNVGFQVEQPSLKERAQALWQDAGKKLAQGIVDQFAPVKEISKDAYALLRLSKGASGAFETLLKGGKLKLSGGVYDFDEANKGGVVDALLTPLNGEHHDFLRWVAANRAESLMGEDRERLFTLDDISALKTLADGQLSFDFTLKNGPRKGKTTRSRAEAYKDSLTTFNAFNKNVLDMAEQSGLIDPDSRATWESEFYVPFYRVADEESGGVRGMNIKGSVVRQQAFKHLKGGKQALNNDLLDNTLMNWAHLLDASAKNRAAKATLEAAQQVGVAIEAPKGTLDNIASAIGKKNGIVWFMDGGQKRHFMVDDPYIMTAISSLEYAGMNSPIMNAMGAFKHALTIGVTASPFFKIRNLIRDSVQVVGTSSIGVNPLKNVADGWKLTDPKNDAYFRLLAGGGTIHFGTMLEGSEAKRVQALVESGVKDSTILNTDHKVKQFYRKYIEPGITAYNELGNRGEAVNRAALYDQLRKQGMGHAEASLQARDLMDFSMQGSFTSIRFLSQVVPFLNARLQGMYKLGRAANENPKRMAYVTGAVAMASLALLAAYGDDDDWKRREDWDRNNFWWFKVGGIAFRIPKPFELGAIGTLAERSAEYLMDDEMTGKRFRGQVLKLLGDNLSMNPIPQAVKPLLDVYANKDSFRNAPIESMGMERMKSEYRFNDRTSMVARGMSTAANSVTGLVGAEALSPVQIDHLLRGYFGWLGTFAVGTADMIARPVTNQPTQATQDIWKKVTGGIASQLEDAPSRYVSSVYDQAKELEQAYGTWRALQKSGKPEEAAAFFADNREEIARYRSVTQVKSAESKLNERIRQIERNEAMDGDQKREEIRRIRAMKEALAKQLAPA